MKWFKIDQYALKDFYDYIILLDDDTCRVVLHTTDSEFFCYRGMGGKVRWRLERLDSDREVIAFFPLTMFPSKKIKKVN